MRAPPFGGQPLNDIVTSTRLAGFVAPGFVLLGVVFSLLLPATRPHPVRFEGLESGPELGPKPGADVV